MINANSIKWDTWVTNAKSMIDIYTWQMQKSMIEIYGWPNIIIGLFFQQWYKLTIITHQLQQKTLMDIDVSYDNIISVTLYPG